MIWERQPGEPNLWLDRFQKYRLQGPGRALLRAVRQEEAQKGAKRRTLSVPGSWQRAAERYNWKARAEAWDRHIQEQREAKWEKRRQTLREEEWGLAHDLTAKARQMLEASLFRTASTTTSDDGQTVTTIVEPARWTLADIPRFAAAADKLARLAAEMETDRQTISWRAELESAGLDPNDTYQQLVKLLTERLAAGDEPDDGGGAGGGEADSQGES